MPGRFFYRAIPVILGLAAGCSTDNAIVQSPSGKGGSMARFAVNGNYLYVAGKSTIEVFAIDPGFEKINSIDVGFGLETIFVRAPYLYLGAFDAMYIYSIADPSLPEFIFRYSHIVSCDPVVVEGSRAYVTLRSGSGCNRGVNALEIIDISNPMAPELVSNFPMANPHGLAVRDKFLFLCEGQYGLKVFDITNEKKHRVGLPTACPSCLRCH
ncbi:hypothetical protein QQ054_36715 [Oscillatoria amoena NRMC-F 0135]|nr:hypothetical protein [Oscillatoria amoena NRMC-F 0135]